MSVRTVRTCPSCSHEVEMKGRSVVVCDQCGKQADRVKRPYVAGLVSPAGWRCVRFIHDRPVRRGYAPVEYRDFCSATCIGEYEKTHERDRGILS